MLQNISKLYPRFKPFYFTPECGFSPLNVSFGPLRNREILFVCSEPLIGVNLREIIEAMKLSEQFYFLKDIFDLNKDRVDIPGSKTTILNLGFSSPRLIYDSSEPESRFFPAIEDGRIAENRKFKYPLFVPEAGKKYNSVILLLHGLNERSWFKHLAWAQYLCESTGKPVLMFPISFHMNRSLPEWTDRNEMASGIEKRSAQYADIKELSIANFVMSQRLTDVPQRFFLSGYQNALDLTALLKDIKAGKHEIFEQNSSIDVFSYSIGVFLAECMMIANPDNIFDESKFVFFCRGIFVSGNERGIKVYNGQQSL
jgi:hypothetical protein